MPAFHHRAPKPEATSNDRILAEAAVNAAAARLAELDLASVLQRDPDEVTPDGDIYLVEPSDEFIGDLAIVDARATPVSTAHYHDDDEWDSVILLEGEAVLARGLEEIPMKKGDIELIPPGITHFVISDGAVFGALGFPNYNPENQKDVDLINPPADFHAELYAAASASFRQ
ncbi:MAG: cupin domain-containing protein [Patescibacteria group bacterium]